MAETEQEVTVPEVKPPKFDPITTDLKVAELGDAISAERTSMIQGVEDFTPLPSVLKFHSKELGITENQFREAAKAQGFDVDYFAREVGRKGRPTSLVIEDLEAQKIPAVATAPEVRKAQARGKAIAQYGYQRAKKGEGRTVEETGVIPDELTDVIEGRDQNYRVLEYDADIEGTDAVVKPGSKEFEEVMQTTSELLNEDTEDGRVRSELAEKWGQNILLESGLEKYVGSMAAYYTERQAQKRNIDEFDPEYDKLYERNRKRAMREVALMKTNGKWVAPTWMSWEKIFPDQRVSESDDPWLKKAWDRGSRVRIELIGIDGRGEPVFQLTNPVWHLFEMSDVVQSAVAGSLTALGDEDDQRSALERLSEGALTGIENRQTFMDAALATDAARDSTLAAYALGTMGVAATILSPDLLFGTVSAARQVSRTAKALGAVKDFNIKAKTAIPNMAIAASKRAEAEDIVAKAEEAVAAGNIAEARRILTESLPVFEEAQEAEKLVRKRAPGIMDTVDTMDSAIYQRAAEITPEITISGGRKIGKVLGGRFENVESAVHPSMRRREERLRQGTQSLVGYQEYYDTSKIVDELIGIMGDVERGTFRHTRNVLNRVAKVREPARTMLAKGRLSRVDVAEDPELFKAWDDFYTYIDSPAQIPLILSNPEKWVNEATSRFSKLANKSAVDGFDADEAIETVRGALTQAAAASKKIKVDQITDKRQIQKALVGALKSVRANTETRAVSLIFIRDQVAQQALIRAEPVIGRAGAAASKYEEFKDISPMGRQYMKQVKEAFNFTDDEARTAARMLDMRARRWAKETGDTVEAWYMSNFPKEAFKSKAEFLKRMSAAQAPKVKAAIEIPDDIQNEIRLATNAIKRAERALKKAEKGDDGAAILKAQEKLTKAQQRLQDAEAAAAKFIDEAQDAALSEAIDFKATKVLNPAAFLRRLNQLKKKEGAPAYADVGTKGLSEGYMPGTRYVYRDLIKSSSEYAKRVIDAAGDDATLTLDDLLLPEFKASLVDEIRGKARVPGLMIGDQPLMRALSQMADDGITDAFKVNPEDIRRALGDEDILFQAIDGKNPIFYSRLEQIAERLPDKMGVNDVVRFLSGRGAKADEIKWTNIEQFLEDAAAQGKKSVTRDEVLKHLRDNRVVVDEVTAGVVPPNVRAAQADVDAAYAPVEPMVRDFIDTMTDEGFLVENTLAHMVKTNPDKIFGAFETNANLVARITKSAAVKSGKTAPPVSPAEVELSDWYDALSPTAREILNLLQSGESDLFRRPMGYNRKQRMADIDEALRVVDSIIEDARTTGVKPSAVDQRFYTSLRSPDVKEAVARMKRAESAAEELKNSDAFMDFESVKGQLDLLVKEQGSPNLKYKSYTLAGGDNYREVLITLPEPAGPKFTDWYYKRLGIPRSPAGEAAALDKFEALPRDQQDKLMALYRRENAKVLAAVDREPFTGAHGSHWDTPNVLVHFRAKNRVDDQGRKILFIEEIQSDWHQQGRKHGYKDQRIEIPDTVELSIQKLESTKKALDDWKAANPRPPNYQRGLEVKEESGLDVFDFMMPETVDAWKKTLSKEDLGAYESMRSWAKKAYGEAGTSDGELNQVVDAYRDAVKGVVAATDQLGAGFFASGGTIRRYADQSIVPIEDLRNDVTRTLRFQGSPNAVPGAPFKDTKAWAGLAVKRIMRMAADEGFDGVAFIRGEDAAKTVGMPDDAAKSFYDQILPSVVKKHTKVPLGKTGFRDLDADFNFVELTPELKKSVGGPQMLFQRGAPRQTGWEMQELGEGLVELTSAEIRAAEGAGLTFKMDGNTLRVQSSELPEAMRGKGIGQELYLRALRHAQEKGFDFASDIAPSPDAIATYERLIEAGIPLTRKTVEAADGKMVQQFVATADDLADASLDVTPRILFQETPTGIRGATEFLEDGRAFIYALDGAAFDTFIHEFGHVMRRDLGDKSMDVVTDWIKSRGVQVTHKGGRFIGDAKAVEEAEEMFAVGFEAYIREGKPPQPGLKAIFEKMKQWMIDIYSSVKQAEEMGEIKNLKISPELRKVFDNLLDDAAPRRPLLPRTLELIRREMAGPVQKGVEIDVIDQIVRELRRTGGHAITKDDIIKQIGEVKAGKRDMVDLPGTVHLFGAGGARLKGGKSSLTLADLTSLQSSMETSSALLKQAATKVPIIGRSQAIQERKPSEIIDNWMTHRDRGILKYARNVMIGGDPVEDMRKLKPELRARILSGTRLVEQAIGDSVKLIEDGDFQTLFRFLAGDRVVHKATGRQALSSGHDMMGSSAKQLTKSFNDLDTNEYESLLGFFDKLGDSGPYRTIAELVRDPDYQKIETILKTLIQKEGRPGTILNEIMEAAGVKPGQLLPDPEQNLKFFEVLTYSLNLSKRNGKLLRETFEDPQAISHSEAQVVALYANLREVFGTSKANQKRGAILANRTMSLIAGHGMAEKAKMRWVELGLAADENTMTAYKAWMNGEAVSTPEMLARVEQLHQIVGYSPEYIQIAKLEGIGTYVPRVARERLAAATARAVDQKAAGNILGDLLEQVGSGDKTTMNSMTRASAMMYRYMKTRMVRGHFVLKSRYFWMNTMDHFNQIALVAGYRPAMVSTMRLLPQNLLSNPVGQAVMAALKVAGREGDPEAVRKVLTSWGDKGADWAATLLRSSKWHVDLNDILEAGSKGRPTVVLIGGRPYNTLDLRQVMVEEAIFSSFDTSQLGIKIRKSAEEWIKYTDKVSYDPKTGRAIIDQQGKSVARQFTPSTLSKVSEDIAEGWAERERAGAVITLMEMGLDPRTACRVTIDSLYDYAGSMSKWDRNLVWNLFFPFWAFQKNANRQIVNTVFSPGGAYRLGVMRRAYEQGSELLSTLMYQNIVDEFGLDYNSMDQQTRDQYDMMRWYLIERYGMIDQVPPEVKQDIRNWITGVITNKQLADGQLRAAPELRKFLLKTGRARMSEYYVAKPDPKYERFYRQGRPGLRVPYPMQENMRRYAELLKKEDKDAPFTTLFLPEPMYEAAFKHMGYTVASLILAIQQLDSATGINLLTDEDDGTPVTDWRDPATEVADPSRMMIVPQVLEGLGVETMAYPAPLHPVVGKAAYDTGIFDVLVLDASEDPFAAMADIREAEAAGEEAPRKRGTITDARYYLMPGMPQLFYANSPLMEINRTMLQWSQTPVEERAGLRGEMARWARLFFGMETEEVTPQKATRFTSSAARKEFGSKKAEKILKEGRKVQKDPYHRFRKRRTEDE